MAEAIAQHDQLADPYALLEAIDVSDPRLLEQDAWRPYFARLRDEAPVHYAPTAPLGPIGRSRALRTSKPWIRITRPFLRTYDYSRRSAPDFRTRSFIGTDGKAQDEERKAVQPAVAPRQR